MHGCAQASTWQPARVPRANIMANTDSIIQNVGLTDQNRIFLANNNINIELSDTTEKERWKGVVCVAPFESRTEKKLLRFA
jgi:hypothetical protein